MMRNSAAPVAVHNKAVRTKKKPLHGFEQSITITLPPMSTLYFEVPAKRSPARKRRTRPTEKAGKTTASKKTTPHHQGRKG